MDGEGLGVAAATNLADLRSSKLEDVGKLDDDRGSELEDDRGTELEDDCGTELEDDRGTEFEADRGTELEDDRGFELLTFFLLVEAEMGCTNSWRYFA